MGAAADTRHPAVIVLVALIRVLLSAVLIYLAVRLSICAGHGIHSLVEAAAALKWVTAAATTMAGGAIVIAVQAFPNVLGALPRFGRSLGQRDWTEYVVGCWGVIKPMLASVLILTFATVFVAQEVERISVEVIDHGKLADQVTEPILERVAELPRQMSGALTDAMSGLEYTRERALLLDNLQRLRTGGRVGVYHFARFALMFPTARLPQGTTPENLDLNNVLFEEGVSLDDAGRALVARVVKAMIPCGATRRIEMMVEGYASSEPFQNFEAHSDDLNLEVANQRGENVKAAIESAIGSDSRDRFKVDLVTHESLIDMERVREFNDRPGGTVGDSPLPQDLMTRSAHIKITHAGDCAPSL